MTAGGKKRPEAEGECPAGGFEEKLKALNRYHRLHCPPYERLCRGLGEEMPALPAAVFKSVDLYSTEQKNLIGQLSSSGSSGQKRSRIWLDAETARAQQMALYQIVSGVLGTERVPMLIVDSPELLKHSASFSAREAGILGFSLMASKRIYALHADHTLNWENIRSYEQLVKGKKGLIFGFTFLLWKYFCQPLLEADHKPDLSGCLVIHGGGWKKMQDRAVSPEAFRDGIRKACGCTEVYDYYGMAEQTGSIFLACGQGHLHENPYGRIRIVDPMTGRECPAGTPGVIVSQSLLPGSYPGHNILTEDLGVVLGEDDCPCGKAGRYFRVLGRMKQAEIRGCSDTFAESGDSRRKDGSTEPKAGMQADSTAESEEKMQEDGCAEPESGSAGRQKDGITVLAGTFPPLRKIRKVGDRKTSAFLGTLSDRILSDPACRRQPDVYAFGFWCRPGHVRELLRAGDGSRQGKGTILHIAPSNMPVMFGYSWAAALLAGNGSIVRIPSKTHPETELLCRKIQEVSELPEFREFYQSNALIRFERNDRILEGLTDLCQGRMLWGSTAVTEHLSRIRGTGSGHPTDLLFPGKYSISLLDAERMSSLSREALEQYAIRFCGDTYPADQNACSSPKLLLWKTGNLSAGETDRLRRTWWELVCRYAADYPMDAGKMMEKYRELCLAYLRETGLKPVKRRSGQVWTVEVRELPKRISCLEGNLGLFFEARIQRTEELLPFLTGEIQTVTVAEIDGETLWKQIRAAGCAGVDRVVPMGEALQFSLYWDRKDLLRLLSEPGR